MGITRFSGPVYAGTVKETSGTTLGLDVENTGQVVLEQEVNILQIAGLITTNMILPAGATLLSMKMFITTAWNGAATTFNIGTTPSPANELALVAQGSAIGLLDITPGTSATRVAAWIDSSAPDRRIYVQSANAGAGVGRLVMQYAQVSDNAGYA